MKKLVVAFLLTLNLVADQLSLGIGTDVDKVGFLAYHKDPFAVEDNVWGSWYLYHRNYGMWKEFKNDEFEFEEISMDYFKKFQDRVKHNVNLYMNATHSLTVAIEFGKYNSKGGFYKLENLTPDTYFRYGGSDYVSELKLRFKNTAMVTDYDKLFVPRDEASAMLKNRKNSRGEIDRTVRVQYDFKFSDIKISGIPSANGGTMNLDVVGEITRIVYIDQENGKILRELKL